MKKNLEEMQVKVANKRAILESHDGEEFSPITVAKNVLCEDGTTMQDYFDNHSEPNISTKIVNSNSMSKVGQGDNVDFSDNVMDGAYEDVVLKGKSLVNVIQGSSKDKVVLPYSFEEGERVTINDTHSNGRVEVEVKGRTLVNLVPTRAIDYIATSDYDGVNFLGQHSNGGGYSWKVIYDLKPNTKYFISCYVETFDVTEGQYYLLNNPASSSVFSESMRVESTGFYKWILTSQTEFTEDISIALRCQNCNGRGAIKIKNIMIIEYQEGMENWDIPYFEGMASVQAPTIQTCGKNLLPSTKHNWYPIKLKKGTTLTLSTKDSVPSEGGNVILKDKNNQDVWFPIDAGRTKVTHTLNKDVYSMCNATNGTIEYQMELGSTATTYERYQSSSLTLPEEIILRGLPNGVCDTYNTKTKEYTQRIGEATYTGEDIELWKESAKNYESDDIDSFFTYIYTPYAPINSKHYNCNLFPTYNSLPLKPKFEYFHILNTGQAQIVVGIKRSKLSTQNLTGFKQWLSQNPLTIQYELETPIITKIDLPSLKVYNTITHLLGTVGEGSLVPTLASDHTVDYPVVIKPNTKYSIIANHRRRGDEENPISFNLGGANSTVVPGERVTTITTPSTLTHSELRVSGRETQISDVMVIEGEVNRQVPYFEGIGDCKSPILKSVGKNLFDINGEFTKCSYSMGIPFKPSYDATSKLDVISPNEFVITTPNNSYNDGFGQYIDVSGVDEVTVGVTALFNHSKTNLECKVMFLRVGEAIPTTIKDRDELLYPVTTMSVDNGKRAELTLRTKQYARMFIMFSGAWKSEMSGTCSFTVKDIYVGANEEYEPYKSNTTTFTSNDNEIIVLRSLPNGVCDTLNVKTGEYVQIIGEITLDGTKRDDLVYHTVLKDNDGDFIRMIINGCSYYDNNKYGNCDKLPFYHEEKTKDSVEAVFPFAGEKHFYIKIKTSRINGAETMENNSSQLRDAFLNWLAQNPITVQYELATPIVKQVNVEGYPYAYENGHILLESGSQEQSLTPTIEYSIVANRGGQIRSNQRMVERHQKKLDSLYAMTLVNMIDSQYKQVLMKLKSDLGSEVTSWDI